MEIIITGLQVGAAFGLCLAAICIVPIVAVFLLAVAGGAIGLGILAVLHALIWCEDQWEAFWRWKSR